MRYELHVCLEDTGWNYIGTYESLAAGEEAEADRLRAPGGDAICMTQLKPVMEG